LIPFGPMALFQVYPPLLEKNNPSPFNKYLLELLLIEFPAVPSSLIFILSFAFNNVKSP
jgi:hypothetical protein